MVVAEDGAPIPRTDAESVYIYEAAKPSFAAMKAYYALLRKRASDARAADRTVVASLLPALQPAESAALDAIVRSVAANAEEAERYMRKVATATAEEAAIIRLRRPHETRVYTYRVQYERVRRPNRHEVSKGIVKVAHAVKL
jgi:hypothetical protein